MRRVVDGGPARPRSGISHQRTPQSFRVPTPCCTTTDPRHPPGVLSGRRAADVAAGAAPPGRCCAGCRRASRHIAPSSRSEDERAALAAAYPASPHLAASWPRHLSDVVLRRRATRPPSPGQLRGTKIETLLSADAAPATAANDDDDGADACYICLSSDGPMLVNVCACRTSRAHRRCLDELIRTKPDATCGVCRTKFVLHDVPLEAEDGFEGAAAVAQRMPAGVARPRVAVTTMASRCSASAGTASSCRRRRAWASAAAACSRSCCWPGSSSLGVPPRRAVRPLRRAHAQRGAQRGEPLRV